MNELTKEEIELLLVLVSQITIKPTDPDAVRISLLMQGIAKKLASTKEE